MKSKKTFNKKNIIYIIAGLLLLIITIGLTTYICYNLWGKKENIVSNNIIKECPFTLEELYAITDNPELFRKNNQSSYTEYNYVITHFYDYFSKGTPVKVTTKVKEKEGDPNYIEEVLETRYMEYDEYMQQMEVLYDHEKNLREWYEKDPPEDYEPDKPIGTDFRTFAIWLIYD